MTPGVRNDTHKYRGVSKLFLGGDLQFKKPDPTQLACKYMPKITRREAHAATGGATSDSFKWFKWFKIRLGFRFGMTCLSFLTRRMIPLLLELMANEIGNRPNPLLTSSRIHIVMGSTQEGGRLGDGPQRFTQQ